MYYFWRSPNKHSDTYTSSSKHLLSSVNKSPAFGTSFAFRCFSNSLWKQRSSVDDNIVPNGQKSMKNVKTDIVYYIQQCVWLSKSLASTDFIWNRFGIVQTKANISRFFLFLVQSVELLANIVDYCHEKHLNILWTFKCVSSQYK